MRDARACAATGTLQEDATKPLLRCARCRCTHYVDATQQRAHWPAHRRTCMPLRDGEKERVANLKASPAFRELGRDLGAGGSTRTVALLRRCRLLLDQGAPPQEFEATCYAAARAFARASDATVAALLAAPGLAAYLLRGDDGLTAAARATRAAGFGRGLPQADAHGARGPAYAACAARERREWEGGGRAGTAAFAHVYVALLLCGAARRAAPPGAPHQDARGALRAGALAAACRTRALGLWADPTARECGGDAFAALPGLALLLLRTERAAGAEPWLGHLDAARGAPKAPVLCAAVADAMDGASPDTCREVLEAAVARGDACRRAAVAQPPGPTRVESATDVARGEGGFRDYWAAVPFGERAAVCTAAVHALLDGCEFVEPLARLFDAAAQRVRPSAPHDAAVRARPPSLERDAAVRHRVLAAACDAHRGGLIGRPGDDDDARAVAPGVRGMAFRTRRRDESPRRSWRACCAPRTTERSRPSRRSGARGCSASRRSASSSASARSRPCSRRWTSRSARARGRTCPGRATAAARRAARSCGAPSARTAESSTTAPRATATTPSRR